MVTTTAVSRGLLTPESIDVKVPQYVLTAVEAAKGNEEQILSLTQKRETLTEALHGALKRWEGSHPNTSRTQKNQAIYAALELRVDTNKEEYNRVAQMLSRAWRYGQKPNGDDGFDEPEAVRVPRVVSHVIKDFEETLNKQGWQVARAERRAKYLVLYLQPEVASVEG
jgi:hypothetical protein